MMRPDLGGRAALSAGVVAATAMLLAIAGSVAAFGDTAFTPPSGWALYKSSAGLLIWREPHAEAFRQNIVLTRQRSQLGAAAYDAQQIQQLQAAVPGFRLGGFVDALTCGQLGHYFSYGGMNQGRQFVAEHMTLVRSGFAWSVQYTYLASQTPIGSARKSLSTLCGGEQAPGAGSNTTAATRAPAGSPSPASSDFPTQPPAGGVAPTVTPRIGP